MTGFAGTGNGGGGGGKRSKDFGAFLARRGDEGEKGRVGDVDGCERGTTYIFAGIPTSSITPDLLYARSPSR